VIIIRWFWLLVSFILVKLADEMHFATANESWSSLPLRERDLKFPTRCAQNEFLFKVT
jgi:hypothetical protein